VPKPEWEILEFGVKQSRECRRDGCDKLPFWFGAVRVLLSVKNEGWLWGFTVGWIRGVEEQRVKGNWEGEGSYLDRIEFLGSMEVGQISKWMCCDTVSVLVRDVFKTT